MLQASEAGPKEGDESLRERGREFTVGFRSLRPKWEFPTSVEALLSGLAGVIVGNLLKNVKVRSPMPCWAFSIVSLRRSFQTERSTPESRSEVSAGCIGHRRFESVRRWTTELSASYPVQSLLSEYDKNSP